MLDHKEAPLLVALWFILSAHNLRTEIFCLASNSSENLLIDFLLLGFLVMPDVPDAIGVLSVRPSGVETMAASIMALCYCWSSHLTEDLYNFLVFSKKICLWRALSLKNWSTPMATIDCVSCSGYNTPFRMTHCCSNYPILRTASTNLINALDLELWAAYAVLSPVWKHRYSFPDGGISIILVWLLVSNWPWSW